MSIVTQKPLTLSFFISDLTSALLLFNRMAVYRSRSGSEGLYEPATGTVAAPAVLTGANLSPHQLSGKTLLFRVNGAIDVTVLFAGADPYTTAAAIVDITAATAAVVATADVDGHLVLTTVTTGSIASIEILESDAAPFLGFDVGEGALGLDGNVILAPGAHEYFYTDQNSDRSFWYRFQLTHSVTLQLSELSVPVPASRATGVDYAASIACFVKLIDMSGRPIAGRRVTFANPFLPNVVVTTDARFGLFRHYVQMETDRNGYAETRLIRGMTVDISIDGTGFVRRIQIPAVGDSVDILDPTLVIQDEFGIQQANVDFAIRTT